MKLADPPASSMCARSRPAPSSVASTSKSQRMKISTTDPELLKYNALSKVPTLITDDGAYLFDSPVICEYLDFIGSAPKLFPPPGSARWKALTQEALADGILDATQPRRRELTLPQDEGRKSYVVLQQGKVARAVAEFEKQASSLGNLDTIGDIDHRLRALGYLDFRYANEPWRPGHPSSPRGYEKVVKLAPLAETMPRADATLNSAARDLQRHHLRADDHHAAAVAGSAWPQSCTFGDCGGRRSIVVVCLFAESTISATTHPARSFLNVFRPRSESGGDQHDERKFCPP